MDILCKIGDQVGTYKHVDPTQVEEEKKESEEIFGTSARGYKQQIEDFFKSTTSDANNDESLSVELPNGIVIDVPIQYEQEDDLE